VNPEVSSLRKSVSALSVPIYRKDIATTFSVQGDPKSNPMFATSSGVRGIEYMLLEGGFLLRCNVHYYDFPEYDTNVVIHRGFPKPKLHPKDSLTNFTIDSKVGWSAKDLELFGINNSAEQVAASDR